MYGSPNKSDPYSKRIKIPAYKPAPKVSGVAFWMILVLPAGSLAFAFGYAVGAWGWL